MLSRPVVAKQCAARAATRSLFSQASAMPRVAVDEEFPAVPKTYPQAPKAGKITHSVTSSGLKVASSSSDAFVASLGVEIAAGARTETERSAGLSQLFAKMAFRATDARSDLRLFRDIEAIGGVVHKAAGRDFVRYNISVLPDNLEAAAAILAETTLAPRFAQWDIDLQKAQATVEAEEFAACSERSVIDNLHAAAFYDDATLGRPVWTTENFASFDTPELEAFYEQYVNTSRLALVGSGVEHNVLTDVANEFFGGLATGAAAPQQTPAKYVGGESRVKKAAKNTFVALGFETVGKSSAEYGASRVLKALLTSRLNNKKASGFVANYADAGIVGFTGFAAPEQAGAFVDAFVAEIKKVAAAAPSNEELAAAKTAAALEVADVFNSRQGRMAVLGSVALTQTSASSPLAAAQAVTAKAVQELAQKALASRPSLASVGKLSTVPRLDAVIRNLK